MTTSISPRTLLEALQIYLSPDILIPRIPTALQIFAHLQLLSARIISEAGRVLDEQQKLFDELAENEVGPEEWTARGALSRKDARAVKRWAGRAKGVDSMFAFSVALRKQHVLRAMALPKVTPEKVYMLVELYFPASVAEADTDVDEEELPHLYIRMMNMAQRRTLQVYRQEILDIYEDFKRDHAAGRAPSLPPTLSSTSGRDPLSVAGANILREAESVVKDAEEFEAMFAENIGHDGQGSASVKMEDAPLETGLSYIDKLYPQTDASALPSGTAQGIPSSSRIPRTSVRLSAPERPASPVRQQSFAIDNDDRNDDAYPQKSSRAFSASSSPQIIQRLPPKAVQTQVRRVSKPLPPPPDYTRPIAQMGANVSKAQLKPFDAKALKRPRVSAEDLAGRSTSGGKGREGGDAVVPKRSKTQQSVETEEDQSMQRSILGNKGGLENSQSSNESQQTKERKREEKGKGRADGRQVERKAVDRRSS